MILLIDNYDSFSYNLYQLVGALSPDIKVVRNDEFTLDGIEKQKPSRIIISPGPGRPADAGLCEETIVKFAGKIPILGVCLGHQAICEAFGGVITYAKTLMHGKQSEIIITERCKLFGGLPDKFLGARYHSLAAESGTLPDCLTVTAVSGDGEVMAARHKEYEVYGLQFHPESVLTPLGKEILKNFII